ncbi:peptidylprolyl isomerase [Flavobacterium phycosphaerae]|uniref:peptidylprolyl isomerase n=1 Tax=Flavobacterium phycosphaerae TaxID=2697515 RepID=UPI001389821E|nr:peptidylprolyl isomerase [Flavobacterium phycosphaerae]
MNKKIGLFLAIIALTLSSCKDEYKNLKDGLYAEIETSKGTILLQLEYQKAPITVANFVSLAEGKNPFVSKDLKGKPFYDGLQFHRVIPDFMIQTGDPLGNGSGDAGYKFRDEITDLKHDKPGILSMANSGPNSNSSQFFITHVETPWLDGRHAIFGHVVEGMDVVNAITQGDVMNTVTIIRKGEDVKKFDAVKVFNDYFKAELENQKKQAALDAESKRLYDEKYKGVKAKKVAYFEALKKSAVKSSTGLCYKITQKTNGEKPKDGTTLLIKYSGFLEDGTLFDTSNPEVAKQFGKYDEQRAMQNGYSALPFQVGGHNQIIPGFVEAMGKMKIGDKAIIYIPSNLGYGEQGAGNVIPPNANLVFEIEVTVK